MVSMIQPEGEGGGDPESLIRSSEGRSLDVWQHHRGEIAVVWRFGRMFPRPKLTACFVIGRAVDPGFTPPRPPPRRPRRGRRNQRSEKTVLFSERAGLLDSVRFFRTDLGKTRWSSRGPAKPNRTSPCKVNPEIYINKYSSGP